MGGSAVDEETGVYKLKEGQEVVVSSTYGIPKRAADGGGLPPRYQAAAAAHLADKIERK